MRIQIRSLGVPTNFNFLTKDLSSTGAFVICDNFKAYPFIPNSTILDCVVDLGTEGTREISKLTFLGRIMRVVDQGDTHGFGVKMIQISHEEKQVLDAFVQRHGSPDLSIHESHEEHVTQNNLAGEPFPEEEIKSAS